MKPLTRDIKAALAASADPTRAGQQRAYMKSDMPYHGVAAPGVASICRTCFREHPMANADDWQQNILDIWRNAAFREERYAAQSLAGVPRYRRYQSMATLPVYEEMIVDGAWWDLVDAVSGRTGELLDDYPNEMTPVVYGWSEHDNMWLRRSAIIGQLKRADRTDTHLLFHAITRNLGDREFFIRKAIGWALRNLSITAPDTVIEFVEQHREALSPLSKREAYKRMLKSGMVSRVP